ncbi:MAG TPA: Ig-like domain-containing protein [Phnomibacter sp.]|nr:Ig-like domain-containing protein [Phnomibacter sp.]
MKNGPFSILACWLLGGWAIALLWGTYGCASIGAPTGGPKDTIPPELVRVVPENFTPNFKSKTIVFNFSEYVELNQVFEKLIINPPLDKFPQVDRKLSTVTVRIKDTLEPNTTYSWRFDGVIRDVNEGNPLGDLTYVFSTGPDFDSAAFSGRVISAETGKVDTTLLVILHRDLSDTAVKKLKPRYVTKLDGKGFFRFNYLAPGRYNVFALKDDGMKRYSDSTNPFAFHNDVIEVSDDTPPVEMLFFTVDGEVKSKEKDEAAEEAAKKREEEAAKRPIQVRPEFSSGGTHDMLQDLTLQLSKPLADFDSSLVFFGDTTFKPLGPFRIFPDSLGKTLTVSFNWKLDTWYQLIFPKESMTDSAGKALAKSDTIRFKTKGESDYGSVKIELDGLDFEKNPVLIMLEANKIYKRIPLTGRVFTDKLFKPGEYEIRLLLDDNKNGKWDTGDYNTKRQPERNLDIPQKITVRGNWENEFKIDINAATSEGEEE